MLYRILNLPRPPCPVLASEKKWKVKKVKWEFFVPDFAETWHTNSSRGENFRNFRLFWFCSKNVEKNPIQVWKLGNFLIFFSKSHYYRGLFFRKKIVSDLAQNWLRWSSEKINFRNFRVFWFCSKNVEKNPIQVRNFGFFFSKSQYYRGLFFQNFPWELLVKWTRIKFKGNYLYFFQEGQKKKYKGFPCKKKYMGILYKINSDQI